MASNGNWISALSNSVTRRTSVMTPLLVLDLVVGVLSVLVYFKDGSWLLFIFLAITVVFTLKKYNDFSKTAPWMLSSERIQRFGMQLTLGDSSGEIDSSNILDLKPVENPDQAKGRLEA